MHGKKSGLLRQASQTRYDLPDQVIFHPRDDKMMCPVGTDPCTLIVTPATPFPFRDSWGSHMFSSFSVE